MLSPIFPLQRLGVGDSMILCRAASNGSPTNILGSMSNWMLNVFVKHKGSQNSLMATPIVLYMFFIYRSHVWSCKYLWDPVLNQYHKWQVSIFFFFLLWSIWFYAKVKDFAIMFFAHSPPGDSENLFTLLCRWINCGLGGIVKACISKRRSVWHEVWHEVQDEDVYVCVSRRVLKRGYQNLRWAASAGFYTWHGIHLSESQSLPVTGIHIDLAH